MIFVFVHELVRLKARRVKPDLSFYLLYTFLAKKNIDPHTFKAALKETLRLTKLSKRTTLLYMYKQYIYMYVPPE